MDWTETTERLIQDTKILEDFQMSDEFHKAFEEWAVKEYPEEFGND